MLRRWKDARHLLPLAAVFLGGLTLFVAVRGALMPAEFGKYGHYRPGTLADVRARPVSFAGQAACADCHADKVEERSKGKHRIVSCEACHGALAKHAGDPAAVHPQKLGNTPLCQGCHQEDKAKPAGFPQVMPAEHSGGQACVSCHQPHAPKL